MVLTLNRRYFDTATLTFMMSERTYVGVDFNVQFWETTSEKFVKEICNYIPNKDANFWMLDYIIKPDNYVSFLVLDFDPKGLDNYEEYAKEIRIPWEGVNSLNYIVHHKKED